MAADKTVVSAGHAALSANTEYTMNLTGAGRYVDIVAHTTGSNDDIYFDVAPSEAGLSSITLLGDEMQVIHASERIRIPVPKDTWIRFETSHAGQTVSVVKVNTLF